MFGLAIQIILGPAELFLCVKFIQLKIYTKIPFLCTVCILTFGLLLLKAILFSQDLWQWQRRLMILLIKLEAMEKVNFTK